MKKIIMMQSVLMCIFLLISSCCSEECPEPKERHIFTQLMAEYPECSVQMYIEPPGPIQACYEPEYIKCDVSGKAGECNFCLINDPNQMDDVVSCNLDGSCNHTY